MESIRSTFLEAFAAIERNEFIVRNIFMGATVYSLLSHFLRDCLDAERQREIIRTGLVSTLFGAQIIVSSIVPPAEIYLTAENNFVGMLPIRENITVLSMDNPNPLERTIRWSVFEQIGMVIFNPAGVVRILLPTADRPILPRTSSPRRV